MFGCPCLYILGTSLEDRETASVHDKLPEHCAQVSSLSAVMNSPVSKMEVEQTSAQQEMLPQDIG
jgi:hypothetical protein